MTGNVIPLHGPRRRGQSAEGTLACPVCECQWFHLVRSDDGNLMELGAVTLAADGRVTGYAGTPTCQNCGTPITPWKETP